MLDPRTNLQRSIGVNATANEQASLFLRHLFRPDDLIELRAIDRSANTGRVVRRQFLSPRDIIKKLNSIQAVNEKEQCEIFFGVNPRDNHQGTKEAISTVRSIWVDLDNHDFASAQHDWQGVLPDPSIVVGSGSGIHAYWLLREPIAILCREKQREFEAMLKRLYIDIGADCVQDVCRMLRLPGTLNFKSFHQRGRSPQPCKLLFASDNVYPIETFDRWFDQSARVIEPSATLPLTCKRLEVAKQIIGALDHDTNDRSKRDFAVIAAIIRAGITDSDTVFELVRNKSKFRNGRGYFDRTWSAAERTVAQSATDVCLDLETEPSLELVGELPAIQRQTAKRRRLGHLRNSITHEFQLGEETTGYIIVDLFDDGRPGQLFLRVGKPGTTISGLAATIGALTSMCLQHGVSVSELSDKFSHDRFEPCGPTGNSDIPIAKSLTDYVFRW